MTCVVAPFFYPYDARPPTLALIAYADDSHRAVYRNAAVRRIQTPTHAGSDRRAAA